MGAARHERAAVVRQDVQGGQGLQHGDGLNAEPRQRTGAIQPIDAVIAGAGTRARFATDALENLPLAVARFVNGVVTGGEPNEHGHVLE
jgi:hypothetical protein